MKKGTLNATKHDKFENIAGSVWLSLFMSTFQNWNVEWSMIKEPKGSMCSCSPFSKMYDEEVGKDTEVWVTF
jgi:hypothetical protein